ncbi:MAG: DUF3419 family protein [Stappiaceae bacterium]
MSGGNIEKRARFDAIRYAQGWEDADVLVGALGDQRGKDLVSISAAGDNTLAMLTLDPANILAVDLSQAQIACLQLRIKAFQTLDHTELLELLGARKSHRRGDLLDRAASKLDGEAQALWAPLTEDVIKWGLGGVGKFERYFRHFRRFVLPLAQSSATINDVFVSRPKAERRRFLDSRWNNWRWRLLLKVFFSNTVMGRLGRDPAFFDHVEGSLAEHVARRIEHAAFELDPAENSYLHWILKGGNDDHLPLAWREEHFETIRSRLERLELKQGPLENYLSGDRRFAGFNLSDIFEYMDQPTFERIYGTLLDAAEPNARLVYWNMMVPRRVPPDYADRVSMLKEQENAGKAADKAFFYSDFIVEAVR